MKAQAGTEWENSKPMSSVSLVKPVRDGPVPNPVAVIDFFIAPVHKLERNTIAIRSLSVPLEEEATYYFFHNFVSEDPTTATAYSQVLPDLYRQNSPFSALSKIIDAIGFAGIANMKHAPKLMVAAGQKYAKVLRAITASIQDSKEASTDQTLMAVMLLGLFEVWHSRKINSYFLF